MTDDPEITDPRDPYKRRDIVAELDRWLEVERRQHHVPPDGAGLIAVAKVERARDEIVALRRTIRLGPDLPALARDEALEEAARVVEDYFNPETCGPCAAAIRALKDNA